MFACGVMMPIDCWKNDSGLAEFDRLYVRENTLSHKFNIFQYVVILNGFST